jgi:hypothetical protein
VAGAPVPDDANPHRVSDGRNTNGTSARFSVSAGDSVVGTAFVRELVVGYAPVELFEDELQLAGATKRTRQPLEHGAIVLDAPFLVAEPGTPASVGAEST